MPDTTSFEFLVQSFSRLERRIWCEVAIQRNSGHEKRDHGPTDDNPLSLCGIFPETSIAHENRRAFC